MFVLVPHDSLLETPLTPGTNEEKQAPTKCQSDHHFSTIRFSQRDRAITRLQKLDFQAEHQPPFEPVCICPPKFQKPNQKFLGGVVVEGRACQPRYQNSRSLTKLTKVQTP